MGVISNSRRGQYGGHSEFLWKKFSKKEVSFRKIMGVNLKKRCKILFKKVSVWGSFRIVVGVTMGVRRKKKLGEK